MVCAIFKTKKKASQHDTQFESLPAGRRNHTSASKQTKTESGERRNQSKSEFKASDTYMSQPPPPSPPSHVPAPSNVICVKYRESNNCRGQRISIEFTYISNFLCIHAVIKCILVQPDIKNKAFSETPSPPIPCTAPPSIINTPSHSFTNPLVSTAVMC